MSVAKADRGKSNFEVEDRSRRIRKAIIDFLLRDMGMKANKRNIRNSSIGKYKRHEDGGIEFYARIPPKPERHNIIEDTFVFIPDGKSNSDSGGLQVYEIPGWILEKYRNELWHYAREISVNVRMANKIYAYYPDEYHHRRELQNKALSACHALHETLLFLSEDFPVTLKAITPIIKMLEEEIDGIRGWKKKENSVLIICYKHEAERMRKGYDKYIKECVKNLSKRVNKNDMA